MKTRKQREVIPFVPVEIVLTFESELELAQWHALFSHTGICHFMDPEQAWVGKFRDQLMDASQERAILASRALENLTNVFSP